MKDEPITHDRKRNCLANYNYSQDGYYFVTVCTKEYEHFFGEVKNNKMTKSEIGKIAAQCWQEIPQHFSELALDEWIVMPNHVHGILLINSSLQDSSVGNRHACSLHTQKQELKPQYQTIPVVVGSYKSAVSKLVNRFVIETCVDIDSPLRVFGWQKSYYDHVIHSKRVLNNIRSYITRNPKNWKKDLENIEYYPELSTVERSVQIQNHYQNLSVLPKS